MFKWLTGQAQAPEEVASNPAFVVSFTTTFMFITQWRFNCIVSGPSSGCSRAAWEEETAGDSGAKWKGMGQRMGRCLVEVRDGAAVRHNSKDVETFTCCTHLGKAIHRREPRSHLMDDT